jgi:hypothetical protein
MHSDTFVVSLPRNYAGPGAPVITLVVLGLMVAILVAVYARKGR